MQSTIAEISTEAKENLSLQEEKELQQEEYQNRLAWGTYNGIISYFVSYPTK